MAEKKNDQPEQLALSLPYEELTGLIAGRPTIRKDDRISDANIASYTVALKYIEPRPGFNPRKKFKDIPELADSLLHDGQREAIRVFVLKDGRILFYEGDRRYRAFQHLLEEKKITEDHKILIIPAKYDVTEEQILRESCISNFGLYKHSFLPVEQADAAYRFKYFFTEKPRTDEEVAEILRCSRQTISNLIAIAEAPDDIRQRLIDEEINMTDAMTIIRSQKKLQKQADKKEDESHVNSATPPPPPQDLLKKDIEELNDLEEQAAHFNSDDARTKREELELQRLFEYANEVLCNRDDLFAQIGKRLAKDATVTEEQQILDNGSGELVPTPITTTIVSQETELTDEVIHLLIEKKVGSVFVYKKHHVAESVFTEPPAEKEKSKYDEQRPEIGWVQNVIKLSDKMSVRVEKLEISDGDKKDMLDWIKWMQNDLWPLRDWVHSNKKQNKIR